MKKKQLEQKEFSPDINKGLSSDEIAYQIESGAVNISKDKNGKSYSRIIVENVFTFFNMLMLAIAAVELIFCGINMITNFGFLMLAFFNTSIGVVQECKSKRTIDKLRLLNDIPVNVIRNGETVEIKANEIVRSDIVSIKIGDQIPADLEIVEIPGNGFVEVNESLLTGESHPVKKQNGDILLAGSCIISGSCKAIVKKVGKETYLNSIESKAKVFKKPKSQLLVSIYRIIKLMAAISIPLSLLVFWNELIGSAKNPNITGIYTIFDEFRLGGDNVEFMKQSLLYEPMRWAGMTVSYMIPAGMILLSSVAMGTGVINLAKKKALTKDLYSVENLSRVDTLCLDKTGTITDGTMNVVNEIQFTGDYTIKTLGQIVSSYMSAFSTVNQTSSAMIEKYGSNEYFKVIRKLEFSSDRKYSAVEFEDKGLFALGAPEYLTKDPLVLEQSSDFTKNGMRVILLVRINNGHLKEDSEELPTLLTKKENIAMFVIRDHIRPEIKGTMKWFGENDVDIRVISGDNVDTVSYIAKEAGIQNWDKCVDMSKVKEDENLDRIVMGNNIFGRVSPEQKAEIVDILKKHGRTVAMTGDGINDLISLKKADCSIALANGAPATKNIANIVLMDSNFSNMKEAVLEGRRVVNNIQRSSTLFIMKDFLWMFMIILPLLLGIGHVVESSIMMIINTFITGAGSTLLAFEPNKERIKGSFIKTVIGKGMVAATFMFLPVFACHLYAFCLAGLGTNGSGELEAVQMIRELTPVMAICLTASGFIVFYNICRPFSTFRRWLFCVTLGIVVVMLIATPELFLMNGSDLLAQIRELYRTQYNNNLLECIKGLLGNVFSMKFYKETILPYKARWIFILVFMAIIIPLYLITDKYVTRFLNKTIFNANKFEDVKE